MTILRTAFSPRKADRNMATNSLQQKLNLDNIQNELII